MLLVMCILASLAILVTLELLEPKTTCRKEGSDYIIRISEQYIDHAESAAKIGDYVLKSINELEN